MSRSKVKDRAALEERIGYSFADKALLERALTHIFNVFRRRSARPRFIGGGEGRRIWNMACPGAGKEHGR
jgi:hypothetical protein